MDALFAEIDRSIDRGAVVVDEREAAEGAEWLEKIEEENAGRADPERIAALEAAAATEDALGTGTVRRCRWPAPRRPSASRWTRTLRPRRGAASLGPRTRLGDRAVRWRRPCGPAGSRGCGARPWWWRTASKRTRYWSQSARAGGRHCR